MRKLCFCILFTGLASFGLMAPAAAEPREHIVKVFSDLDTFEMYFAPKTLHIRSGDTVTWVNQATMDHNIITYPDGYPEGAQPIRSPYLSKTGDSWSYTFDAPGSYEYHCLPHVTFGMHGFIVVDRPSHEGEFHRPSKAEVAAYRQLLLEFPHLADLDGRSFPKNPSAAEEVNRLDGGFSRIDGKDA